MKQIFAFLLVVFISSGVFFYHLNPYFSDSFQESISHLNSEIDVDTDDREGEEKILYEINPSISADGKCGARVIYFYQNPYASILMKDFYTPPEIGFLF